MNKITLTWGTRHIVKEYTMGYTLCNRQLLGMSRDRRDTSHMWSTMWYLGVSENGGYPKAAFLCAGKGWKTPLELALHNLHIVYLWHSNVAIWNPALFMGSFMGNIMLDFLPRLIRGINPVRDLIVLGKHQIWMDPCLNREQLFCPSSPLQHFWWRLNSEVFLDSICIFLLSYPPFFCGQNGSNQHVSDFLCFLHQDFVHL